MSRTDFSPFSDEALLLYALDHGQDAWPEIADRYGRRMASWCRTKAWGIPEDIRADVAQETLLSLFTKLSAFDPIRGTANQFVFGLFLNALKKVRRSYRARPGLQPLSLSSGIHQGEFMLEDTLAAQYDGTEPSAERLHTKEAARQIVEHSLTAPPLVKQAIQLLASDEYLSMSKVAVQLGVNRVTLTRHIRKWAARHKYAVAA